MLDCVILDSDVTVRDHVTLKGTPEHPVIVKKGATVRGWPWPRQRQSPLPRRAGWLTSSGLCLRRWRDFPDVQVCVFLPYHKIIRENETVQVEFLQSFPVDLAWRKQHVGLFRLSRSTPDCTVYFIDNRQYFDRDGLYGELDDGERYAYFSKAVLESMVQLGLQADILQCHDWHTALIPVFLNAQYRSSFPKLQNRVYYPQYPVSGVGRALFLRRRTGTAPGAYRMCCATRVRSI